MTFYDLEVKTIEESYKLARYKGSVLLIVNTATHCYFTRQYDGLETLYQTYKDQGLFVLDFPSNQFASQTPEDDESITRFCSINFKTTFPRFLKSDVNGQLENPVFTYLKKGKRGLFSSRIKWNFTKFLVDQNGRVVKRYGPSVKPSKIEKDIKRLIRN